jgi:hypothetical protein
VATRSPRRVNDDRIKMLITGVVPIVIQFGLAIAG